MLLIRAAEHRRMAWKNGGGETLEVAVYPPDAGIDAFGWRVSIATVRTDGPFSAFPGVDRTLAVLSGDGMALDIAGNQHVLTAADDPLPFPADVATTARLLGGAVTDLNVMTRRGQYAHRMEWLGAARWSPPPTLAMVVAAAASTLTVDGTPVALEPLDVLLLDGVRTVVAAPAAEALLIEIESR